MVGSSVYSKEYSIVQYGKKYVVIMYKEYVVNDRVKQLNVI